MSVCPPCRGTVHDSKPDNCPGGTWCDCQHRLPLEVAKQMNEESATSNKLVDTGEGTNV